MRVEVAGFGAWGLAFGALLARRGAATTLLTAPHEDADAFNRTTRHPLFPQWDLPGGLVARQRASDAPPPDLLVWAVPGTFTADWLEAGVLDARKKTPLVVLSKGLAPEGFEPVGAWLARRAKAPVVVLSGPNFASEVLRGLPAAAVLGGPTAHFEGILRLLEGSPLRLYPSADLLGVALGGVLKNVYAIGAGMADGADLGENARAALLTRALAEMARVFRCLRANAATLLGLAGVGDLFLTAASPQSRNWQLGNALSKGEGGKAAKAGLRGESEGARTVGGLVSLAKAQDLDLPLAHAIHDVIQEKSDVPTAVRSLLSRPPKPDEQT